MRLWDATTGTLKNTLTGHTAYVNSVAFSPDGNTIVSGSGDDTVRLWDVETGTLKNTLTGHTAYVNSVAFSPDGNTIVSGSGDDTVRLWNVATGTLKNTLTGHTGWVESVAFSPDGKTIASIGVWGNVRLWDVATGSLRNTLTSPIVAGSSGPHHGSGSVAFSPDGNTIANGGWDHTVSLWDVETGTLKNTLTGHFNKIESVAYSPDGSILASGSQDGTMLLWDIVFIDGINGDGVVDIEDLMLVVSNLGKTGKNIADVNRDGVVDIRDVVKVAGALENPAASPSLYLQTYAKFFNASDMRKWITEAQHLNLTDITSQRGIHVLQQLLATLIPKKTTLLPNYPNPFNPETWIPYQLEKPADVTLTIYALDGKVIRKSSLGHQAAGIYQSKSRAAYWDGRNAVGEPVASGVYFYTLTTGGFTATRKMLIMK